MQLCHLKLNTLYNSDQVILDEMQYLTHFEFNFNVWETDKCKLSDLHLPKSLTHLSPGIRFIGSLAGIPDTVTHLTLSSSFPLHLFPPPKSIQNIKWY